MTPLEQLEAENARLELAYLRAVGWRERDWPEGFDRRTADLLAEWVREAMEDER